MKKMKKICQTLLLAFAAVFVIVMPVLAEEAPKGLSEINGNTYVYDANGILQISKWTKIGKEYYYSDANGVLVRNRMVKREDTYCYVQEDGTVLKSSWKVMPNGEICYFGAKGTGFTGVRKIGDTVYGFGSTKGYLKKNAWVKKADKVYRTDKSGVIQRDKLIKVDGDYYYLGRYGVRFEKKWKALPKGRSYFAGNGKRVTGEKKIEGQLYYFNAKGYLVIGKTKVQTGNTTYYLNGKGAVEMKVVKTGSTEKYYSSRGNEKSFSWANNYLTLQTAKKIVDQITDSGMSRDEKLDACFMWVVRKPYVIRRVFTNQKGWPALYANDHFLAGGGDCRADAAAFAYMAKVLGYNKIYLCCDDASDASHSWAEINGRVYDPLFWEAKGRSSVYYGGSYGAYGLWPEVRTAL